MWRQNNMSQDYFSHGSTYLTAALKALQLAKYEWNTDANSKKDKNTDANSDRSKNTLAWQLSYPLVKYKWNTDAYLDTNKNIHMPGSCPSHWPQHTASDRRCARHSWKIPWRTPRCRCPWTWRSRWSGPRTPSPRWWWAPPRARLPGSWQGRRQWSPILGGRSGNVASSGFMLYSP